MDDSSAQGLPEATMRGITLRGLRKLQTLLLQLASEERFPGETDFSHLTTTDIVYKCEPTPQFHLLRPRLRAIEPTPGTPTAGGSRMPR